MARVCRHVWVTLIETHRVRSRRSHRVQRLVDAVVEVGTFHDVHFGQIRAVLGVDVGVKIQAVVADKHAQQCKRGKVVTGVAVCRNKHAVAYCLYLIPRQTDIVCRFAKACRLLQFVTAHNHQFGRAAPFYFRVAVDNFQCNTRCAVDMRRDETRRLGNGIFVAVRIVCHNLVLRCAVHYKRDTCIGNIVHALVQAVGYLVFGTFVFGNDVIAIVGLLDACAQRKQRNRHTHKSNYL